MSAEEHRADAPGVLRFAVLTVSDTRTKDDDESGQLIIELVQAAFHEVTGRALCKDDPEAIRDLVRKACAREDVEVLVVTGGTGFSRRDATPKVMEELYDQVIPGFGELFRMLSFQEVGAAAMLSRASAGVVAGRPVFSLPGSASAVRLAMEKLVLPEIPHLLQQLRN